MAVTGIPNKVFGQVCLIVKDVEASARRYKDILGIDFGDSFQTTHPHDHTNAVYYGQPMDARAKLTSVIIGNLQFDLLQPLDEGSEEPTRACLAKRLPIATQNAPTKQVRLVRAFARG